MKKFIVFLLSSLLALTTMTSLSAQYTDYNIELNIGIGNESMLSGERNVLQLEVKTTGPQTTFTDTTIRIKSSVGNIIFEDGVLDTYVPHYFDSYEIRDDELLLRKDIYDSGTFIDLPIFFTTHNGLTLSDTKVDFTIDFTSNEYSKTYNTVSTIVDASSPLKINKEFNGIVNETTQNVHAFYGQETLWLTRAIIDKKDSGQHFIKENTKVVITEVYDEELIFESIVEGPAFKSHDLATRTITWEFDAPSYSDQDKSLGSLWSQEIVINYKTMDQVEEKVRMGVGSEVTLTFTDVRDIVNIDSDRKVISIYPNAPTIPDLKGNWNVFGTWGPLDGKGNHGYKSVADMNTIPTVLQTDNVTYMHRLSSMFTGRYVGYQVYKVNYHIDDYLELNTLTIPTKWIYFPDNMNFETKPLAEIPSYDVYFLNKEVMMDKMGNNVLNEDDIIAHFVMGRDFDHGHQFTRGEILAQKGLPDNTHIAQVQYDFHNTGPGMFAQVNSAGNNGFTYNFNINTDWRESTTYEADVDTATMTNDMVIYAEANVGDFPGHIERNFQSELWDYREDTINGKNTCIDYSGIERKGNWIENSNVYMSCMYITRKDKRVGFPDGFVSTNHWSVNGPRSNKVTGAYDEKYPTVTNTIELENNFKGLVYTGDNNLKVSVNNHDDISVTGLKSGGLSTYIAVPKNLDLDLNNVKAYHTYAGDVSVVVRKLDLAIGNLDYYIIEWDHGGDNYIAVDTSLFIEIPTFVNQGESNLNMHVFTDLFNEKLFNTLVVDDPKITDTKIVGDLHNITGNGDDYKLLQASNHYRMVKDFSVETRKLVKGSLDSAYSSAGRTEIDGLVEYKLLFKNNENRDINHFTLLDTLPSIDDLGITDSVFRGSEFGLVLNSKVVVSDKFEVYYSKSANPKRDDLNDQMLADGFDPIINPVNAEDPNWLLESEVDNFNEIKSFMIKLKENEVLANNEIAEIDFTAVVDEKDYAIVEAIGYGAVAWNSFALTIDNKPVVEPLQVKVTYDLDLEYTDFTAYKLWEDTNETEEVKVNLLKNGEVIDTIVMDGSEIDPFTYTWTNLLKVDEKGVDYIYTVEEVVDSDKYIVTVKDNVIVNKLVTEPVEPEPEDVVDKEKPKNPETGISDSQNNLSLYTLLVSSSLLLLLVLRRKYRVDKNN